jgi:hypothetical protein
MKTDSQRQLEYQQRRRETHERITVWVSTEVEQGMDILRGSESRTAWINRAITELTIRQLLQRPLMFNDAELREAQMRGRELGIIIPD